MGDKQSVLNPEMLSELSQETRLTEEEIKQWYKGFIKTCPSGRLKKAEFQKTYSALFPQGDASLFAGHVFRTFDANKDGEIDFREFLILLRVTRRGSLEERLRWIFDIYDLDGDGYITRDEMKKVITAMHKMAGRNVHYPADESTPERRTDKIFRTTDRNQDNRLSFIEFREGATSDRLIAQLLESTATNGSQSERPLRVRQDQHVSLA